jgi:hypothetical protein
MEKKQFGSKSPQLLFSVQPPFQRLSIIPRLLLSITEPGFVRFSIVFYLFLNINIKTTKPTITMMINALPKPAICVLFMSAVSVSAQEWKWELPPRLWPFLNMNRSMPDIIKGSQLFYRNYGVHESELVAKCESHFLGDSEVSLTPTPDSTIGKLDFGISLIGVSNLVLVKRCRVKWR